MAMFGHEPAGYACPFCALVAGVDSTVSNQEDIVARTDDAVAFIGARWWPNNHGHVLVVPAEHHETSTTCPPGAVTPSMTWCSGSRWHFARPMDVTGYRRASTTSRPEGKTSGTTTCICFRVTRATNSTAPGRIPNTSPPATGGRTHASSENGCPSDDSDRDKSIRPVRARRARCTIPSGHVFGGRRAI